MSAETMARQLCRYYNKRHNGSWYRTAARELLRELRAERRERP